MKKVKITPIESFKFRQLFESDIEGNIIIEDDMKGVFEEECVWRTKTFYVRSDEHFLIIHDVDKMINFLKTAKRLRNLKASNFHNSIKSIIKKINKGVV